MNTDEKEKLRRMMGEAAALSPDDPERRAVEAEIAREGEWAEKEWLDVLGFDEHVRVELQRVPIPAGLEERLYSIPGEADARRRPIFRWAVTAAAAALMLICAGIAYFFVNGGTTGRRIREIGLTAIADHAAHKPLTIETRDESVLLASLGPQVYFKAIFPKLGEGFRLVGGRKCSLADRPVIYTRWEKDGYEYSLCLFCPKDFGLPSEFPRVTVVPKGGRGKGSHQALVWAEGGCAYVLVAESGALAPGLTTGSLSGKNAPVLATNVFAY
jgi:hypothetical protein